MCGSCGRGKKNILFIIYVPVRMWKNSPPVGRRSVFWSHQGNKLLDGEVEKFLFPTFFIWGCRWVQAQGALSWTKVCMIIIRANQLKTAGDAQRKSVPLLNNRCCGHDSIVITRM